ALGTNKLQGLFGSGSATIAYASKGHVDLKKQLPSACLSFVGSVAGALLATVLPGDVLRLALPFMLIAIALYFALKPNMNDVDRTERLSPFLFGLLIVPAIGFYDGLFGPGAGSFFMLAFVSLAGYCVLMATAHT
ncbi:TSUP family transporter, partial [Rhizobiaceae sp. 2RAB30]